MSHGDTLTQQARYHSRCTGIGHETSLQHLQTAQGQAPVPAASRDQARLEAAVFEHLGGTIDYCAHPAGIAHVRPSVDHLVVKVDLKLGPEHSLPRHCLEALLPTQYTGPAEDEGLTPGGIAGVRLLEVDSNGLHLGLAGTDARVTLTGPPPEWWQAALARHRSFCRDHHLVPLWDAPALTPFEATYLAADSTWWKEQADRAWIASGLLRRIALFHTVIKPFCIRYWRHGLGWKFELRYEHGVPVGHDRLIKHLTDPRYGLAIQSTRDHCECKKCDCDGGAERNCWFTLDTGGGRRDEIVLHFRHTRAGYDITREYDQLVAAGAAPDWLAQALPAHHRSPAT
ncbi:hypothetical protein ACFFTQ_37190 [Streptomyces roseofulvus]|uniref:hypothetical protein n=1 Tax=Streptomyces roseofulvus TaxID=33902 RepID=UPI0035F096F3